ncbi:MAG: HAMP domain-containing histidine kinase, partial [Gemmatimonadota bacterium]|nr:HAMP domain-containing histidine kinase [Gemmatimonadota bacterium]
TARRAHEREREMLLEEAQDARSDAERANRAKSEFLAVMSHELRTPLNAIIGYAELVQLGIPGALTDEQRSHIGRILTSAHHLLGLVNEVLDLARADNGRLAVEDMTAAARSTIDAALAVIQPLAEARGISISVELGDDDPRYRGDEDRVRQILVNLLGNAVKFTEPGGHITIRSGVTHQPAHEAAVSGPGPWVFLGIDDTGPGIPAAHLSRIFDPFVQVDAGPTRPQDGSGLGLTICRRLARVMHGDVTVQSEEGNGSSFTVWLPAAPSTAQGEGPALASAAKSTLHRAVGDVGEVLLGEIDSVVSSLVERLRSERIVPAAATLRFSRLANQCAAYVADVAALLIAAEEARGQPSAVIADASELQRFVASRHGVQRAKLGYSREALAREWAIVREEIERAIRRAASSVPEPALGEALALVERFIEQARQISERALIRAGRETERKEVQIPGYP